MKRTVLLLYVVCAVLLGWALFDIVRGEEATGFMTVMLALAASAAALGAATLSKRGRKP